MSVGPSNDAAYINYIREQTINNLFRSLNLSGTRSAIYDQELVHWAVTLTPTRVVLYLQ